METCAKDQVQQIGRRSSMCSATCKPLVLREEGFLGFAGWHCDAGNRLVGRARGALTARGTR
ncbi:hypothetical protein, partial [Xanthomonas axonopodis]|uniref:hypothetical protein n=1 Tax=Xanthomonas axonopodis TaxID=53413 RepID=UPI001C261B37